MTEPTVRHLHRADYDAMPWRNGGGVTFEIARSPANGTEFDWRLSLALIDHSGPFSSFAGYQRAIALVSGDGCLLHGIEPQAVTLRRPGDLQLFSGAAAVTCELLGGTTCDFNLMVREPGSIAAARHLVVSDRFEEPLAPRLHHVLFCLAGNVECCDSAGRPIARLGLHDTLLIPPSTQSAWQARAAAGQPAQLLAMAWHTAR